LIHGIIWRYWSRRLARWISGADGGMGVAAVLAELRRLLEARLNKGGRRSMCSVRLLETFRLEEVAPAI